MKKSIKKLGFTLIELMIVVAIIGILASLAIPNFMKFLAKTKQAEAKANLGALYTCQISYFGEKSTYAGTARAFDLIGFDPRSPVVMRYAFIMDNAVIAGIHAPTNLPSGLPSTAISFTAMAVGNIDNDDFLDVWGINDKRELRNQIPTAGGWAGDGSDVMH